MSLGNWEPELEQQKVNFKIDLNLLERFANYSRNQQLDQLNTLLSAEEIQRQAALMQQNKESWLQVAADFSDEKIEGLMRFFTLAEQLPGWQAGSNSPVIWLGKLLKQRGTGINRELQLWIKQHSDNQFLPHGALL